MQGMLEKHTHVNLRFSFIVVSSFTYQKWFKLHTKKRLHFNCMYQKLNLCIYIYNLKTKKNSLHTIALFGYENWVYFNCPFYILTYSLFAGLIDWVFSRATPFVKEEPETQLQPPPLLSRSSGIVQKTLQAHLFCQETCQWELYRVRGGCAASWNAIYFLLSRKECSSSVPAHLLSRKAATAWAKDL